MRYRRIRWMLALLLTTVICHAQTAINLTDNSNGTWTLASMPQSSVRLMIEYEDANLPVVITAPVGKSDLTYTGEAQELVTAGTAEGGVMVYSLDGINYSEVIPTATEVGLYTVYYKAKSNTINCGDSPTEMISVRMTVNRTELKVVITEAETLYETIKDLLPNTAATLLAAINAAIEVQVNMDATQTEVDKAKQTLNEALQAAKDKEAQIINLSDNSDGTWTLVAMPGYNVKLVVEYEDDVEGISLADNSSNTETLNASSGKTVNATLDGRTLLKDGSWNTLCLPFDVEDYEGTPLEGATVKELVSASVDGNTLKLKFASAEAIRAGQPYIVKWEDGEDVVSPTFSGVTISTSDAGKFSGSDGVTFQGTFSPVTLSGGDRSVLFVGSGNKLYWPNADVSVNAFRAYFKIDDESAAKRVTGFSLDMGDGIATGIISAEAAEPTDAMYNLNGQRVSGSYRGVVIMMGRKVLRKKDSQ